VELVRGHGCIEGREFAFEGRHVNGRQFFTMRAGYQKEGKAFREVLIVAGGVPFTAPGLGKGEGDGVVREHSEGRGVNVLLG